MALLRRLGLLSALYVIAATCAPITRAQSPTTTSPAPTEPAAPWPEPRLEDIELRGLRVPAQVHRTLPYPLQLQITRGSRVRRAGLISFGITGVSVAVSTGAYLYCLTTPEAGELFGCMLQGSMMFMTAGPGILVSSVLMGVGRRRLTDARAQVELLAPELSWDTRRVGLVVRVRR